MQTPVKYIFSESLRVVDYEGIFIKIKIQSFPNTAPYFRGGEWSFKNSGPRKISVEFLGSHSLVFSGYVRLVVSIFTRSCLGVSIFRKAKGFEVSIRLSVFINDVFSSLDIEFQLATVKFPRTSFKS